MHRTMTAIALACVIAMPLAASDKDKKDAKKDAKHECRVEYNEAKREARKATTHRERVEGLKAAKAKYKECLERAAK